MLTAVNSIYNSLQDVLGKRIDESLYRSLQVNEGLLDFCSNDYLSFAQSEKNKEQILEYLKRFSPLSGSTGSRSISGNTQLAEELEQTIAAFHKSETGLLFNSGYDANVGLFSTVPKKNDTIICDELIHASIIDGCRLSYATRLRFHHNDVNDLKKKLRLARGNVFVAVESVYSMDGDMAPLKEVSSLCKQYNANLIVDEAHATGVFGKNGRGLVNEYGLEKDVFVRVHTFGKAIGCHGAIVLGNEVLRNYLINFARSFIFTTALPVHSLVSIKSSYEQLALADFDNSHLHLLIPVFKNGFQKRDDAYLLDSISPIQCVIVPGNKRARFVAKQLQQKGFDVRAVLSPSVPVGKERLRISLHLHNTLEDVNGLTGALNEILKA